jgi:hypothetical protein
MHRSVHAIRISLATALFAMCGFSAIAQADDEGRALLVGCTIYDHLPSAVHLKGPSNDVALMREMLCNRFGFPADRVVSLTETEGRPEARPTRANIEREFRRLADVAGNGEQVVIFMAGHGSQQPDVKGKSDEIEPDGLDEIFLPADVKGWDGGVGAVPNAIIDDELSEWLAAIEKRGAAVTIIMDACHSGTMTRGVDETTRELPPGLLVPSDVLRRAPRPAPSPDGELARGRTGGETLCDNKSTVAIYAAQSTEVTVEKLLPPDGDDRKPYGLLSYTINQVLARTSGPITYRDLVQQVQAQYVGWGRTFPTPMIEGVGKDREVLGLRQWPRKTVARLTKGPKGYTVNIGSLQGATRGSILAVFTGTGPDRKVAGHVKVQIARTLDADVVPCEFETHPVEASLPNLATCELVYIDAGDLRLPVQIASADPSTAATASQLTKDLALVLQPREGRPGLVKLVDQSSDAAWIVQVRPDGMQLMPSESAATAPKDLANAITAFAARPINPSGIEWLGIALDRIARADNLKKLAADESTEKSRGADVAQVQLTVERSDKAKSDQNLGAFIDGEELVVRMKNVSPYAVDVTLLYIDRSFGINCIFPAAGEINRLQPNDSTEFPATVEAEEGGLEHLIAIVVPGAGDVIDFSILSQPSIERTRGGPSLDSPLGDLLRNAVFADGKTRGFKRSPTVRQHGFQLRSWRVEPKAP